ncbi:MAG TPA: ATP-binding protein [Candidatus Saccharimonadales bacterium]|nr:ATP-binding protein [Candidatus Saccharimonadales bacterium]
MDYLQKFVDQFRSRLIVLFLINDGLIIFGWWLLSRTMNLHEHLLLAIIVTVLLSWLLVFAWFTAAYLAQPTVLIWQAILHISPKANNVAAPDIKSAPFGRDLVTALSNQVYQLATAAANLDSRAQKESQDLHRNPIAANLPLPLFVLNKDSVIIFANEAAIKYIGSNEVDVIGKNVYGVLDMAFQDNRTLDNWLVAVRNKAVTAYHTWDRVRLKSPDGKRTVLFDLAAYYNRANPFGYETQLIIFDHTKKYSEAEQELSFVAMAVHELRTPLTLLRGYIEALEESSDTKSPDESNLLQRMDAAAHQLAAFINNVLNVARIDDDQFLVQLHEEAWVNIIEAAVSDMRLQAAVRGISIEAKVTGNLPSVGVDRVSIYEVISNLLDNAIKYSGASKRIILDAHLTSEGLVETDIRDFGVGIPETVITNIFDKFSRNHRNRDQIGGTGLGLYLSKIIIQAHGGNIWVRSKEGQGSIFSFTVLPYSKLAVGKQSSPEDFTRTAHGWIKNHTLYRR